MGKFHLFLKISTIESQKQPVSIDADDILRIRTSIDDNRSKNGEIDTKSNPTYTQTSISFSSAIKASAHINM